MGYTQMLIREVNFEFPSLTQMLRYMVRCSGKFYERQPNQTNDKYVENCVGRPGKSSFSFTGGVLGFNKYNGNNSKRCG